MQNLVQNWQRAAELKAQNRWQSKNKTREQNDGDARTYYKGSYPQSLPAGADDAYAFDRCFGTKS